MSTKSGDVYKRQVPILTQLLADLQNARKGKLLWSLDIVALNQKIANVTRQDRLLAQLKQQGLVDPDIFISRRNELAEQLLSLIHISTRSEPGSCGWRLMHG